MTIGRPVRAAASCWSSTSRSWRGHPAGADHGPYDAGRATITEADAALGTWQPHLAIVDMDLVSRVLLEGIGTGQSSTSDYW